MHAIVCLRVIHTFYSTWRVMHNLYGHVLMLQNESCLVLKPQQLHFCIYFLLSMLYFPQITTIFFNCSTYSFTLLSITTNTTNDNNVFLPIDNVFGCHLGTLCAQERATVPSFVEKCIKAVEKRGNPSCLCDFLNHNGSIVSLCAVYKLTYCVIIYRFRHWRTLQSERESGCHSETTLQGWSW